MWKEWLNRITGPLVDPTPDEARAAFMLALGEAQAREELFRPLFEQLAFALRTAESPVPIDRATIPLNLTLGPEKVKELSAQIKLSPYLKNNVQALVHHFRENQRDLKNAERAGELLQAQLHLFVRTESILMLHGLFQFMAASREQFRDYPLFYQLFGGGDDGLAASVQPIPEDLQFFVADSALPAPLDPLGTRQANDGVGDLRNPEALLKAMEVPPLALEVGIDLVPLVAPALGGDLMDRIAPVRAEIARELGFVMPGVQFRDALDLRASAYRIKVRGNTVAQGELMIGYHLAIETGESETTDTPLIGFATTEPVWGRRAHWVTRAEGMRAAKQGYLVFDTTQALVRHLDEVARGHAHEILSLEDVSILLDHLRERAAQTVDAVIPEKLELADYQLVLKNLLRERVSVRDQVTILERLAHAARPVHPFYLADRFGENKASIESIMLMEISAQIRPLNDPTVLTEMVRAALARQICGDLADEHGTLDVLVLEPQVEQVVLDAIQTTTTGQTLTLAPGTRDLLVSRLVAQCQRLDNPIILCDPRIRPFIKQITTRALPRLAVISHAELHPQFRVQSVGTVSLIQG